MSYIFQITAEGKLPEGIKVTLARVIPEFAGKTVKLDLQEYKKKSSTSQREYYFAVIVPAWQKILHEATDSYWDKDDTHEYLMIEIGQWLKDPVIIDGFKYTRRRSYNDLETIEAERHHALCRAKAAEEGYDIPEPNEERIHVITDLHKSSLLMSNDLSCFECPEFTIIHHEAGYEITRDGGAVYRSIPAKEAIELANSKLKMEIVND